ncbi:hypothetical protein MYK68_20160 [Gordonia sp. PP30]|uniref:hypothetical protein n=1 Tax=unclassified Gordonia (in: high G+C Gram-positive bacteria) TaxID=2657482 RepID=UPI001FFE4AD4|nr:hypothetical protein [Gordonia sp. PP30]UQE74975.1 hypothetical protein MYK68_20160 [Gordonia sp. PP30]
MPRRSARKAESPGTAPCASTAPGGFIDSVGWAYVPDAVGVPVSDPNDGGISYAHVTGDWYRFTWHF